MGRYIASYHVTWYSQPPKFMIPVKPRFWDSQIFSGVTVHGRARGGAVG